MTAPEVSVVAEWIVRLKNDVATFLTEEYRLASHWEYTDEELYLSFPAFTFEAVDLVKSGLNRVTSHFKAEQYMDRHTKNLVWRIPKPLHPTLDGIKEKQQQQQVVSEVESVPQQTCGVVAPSYLNDNKSESFSRGEKRDMSENNQNQNNISMDDYIKSNGIFVSPKTCTIGDTFRITKPFYFEKSKYEPNKDVCFIDVVKEATNAEMKIKLNKENAANLAGTFTNNRDAWVGKRIRIISKKTYQMGDAFVYAPI